MTKRIIDLIRDKSINYETTLNVSSLLYRIKNKIIFTITGEFATEILSSRVDSDSECFGMICELPNVLNIYNFEHYLTVNESKELQRLCDRLLCAANIYIGKRVPLLLEDWENFIDVKLSFYGFSKDSFNKCTPEKEMLTTKNIVDVEYKIYRSKYENRYS